jgi:broad specificity phosphatase PhoE
MHVPELWVLRHGETTWNVEARLQGHLDSPLTPLGEAQAEAQGRIMARVLTGAVEVLVSPSGRAWRTAEIALGGRGLPLRAEPRLMEIGLGAWQGQLVSELVLPQPRLNGQTDPHLWKFDAPDGESLPQMVERVRAVLADLSGPTVLVTHGVTSRLLRCTALGLAPERISELPGGQGVVHHLKDGRATLLSDPG